MCRPRPLSSLRIDLSAFSLGDGITSLPHGIQIRCHLARFIDRERAMLAQCHQALFAAILGTEAEDINALPGAPGRADGNTRTPKPGVRPSQTKRPHLSPGAAPSTIVFVRVLRAIITSVVPLGAHWELSGAKTTVQGRNRQPLSL
jgi:hypothetical protein